MVQIKFSKIKNEIGLLNLKSTKMNPKHMVAVSPEAGESNWDSNSVHNVLQSSNVPAETIEASKFANKWSD